MATTTTSLVDSWDGLTSTAVPALPPPLLAQPEVHDPPSTSLERYISATQACLLRPLCFFVSWQGVITLAYKGFPPSLVALKEALNTKLPALPAENPGSKWPKTTLGALGNSVRLTPQQLQTLLTICREESGRFVRPQSPKTQAVLVDSLSIALYECRSLEGLLSRRLLPLVPVLDPSDALPQEQQRVEALVAEADSPDYWFHVARDGGREAHYHSPALGATLIHELAHFKLPSQQQQQQQHAVRPGRVSSLSGNGSLVADPSLYGTALPAIIQGFRERVDRELPGLYVWFNDSSLHVTIRALMG